MFLNKANWRKKLNKKMDIPAKLILKIAFKKKAAGKNYLEEQSLNETI